MLRETVARGRVKVAEHPLLHAEHVQHHVAVRTRPDLLLLADELHADRAAVLLLAQVALQVLAQRQVRVGGGRCT